MLFCVFVCQIHLRECERLDESLALALKHLSTPHHSTHTCSRTDTDRQKCHQTHTITATGTNTHSDTGNAETHKENWMEVSTLLDSCSGELTCFYFEMSLTVCTTMLLQYYPALPVVTL